MQLLLPRRAMAAAALRPEKSDNGARGNKTHCKIKKRKSFFDFVSLLFFFSKTLSFFPFPSPSTSFFFLFHASPLRLASSPSCAANSSPLSSSVAP